MPGGNLVAGRYLAGRLLGQGGMGRVHAAWDTILERRVALKTLHGGAAHRDEDVTRFRAEARNAASLSHPNIVRVFDAGEDDGLPYIAMELVVGDTLAEAIDVHGPLPPARAVSLALEAAEALAAAHDNGIVHCDIKPQNILVDDQGHARVVDFGIAAPFGRPDNERTRTVEGTAAYLSPEQVAGMAASPMSDLYSLGAVLYEMLAGCRAFGDSESDDLVVARMHLTEHPASPRVYAPSMPPELEGLVLRLLSKDPERRSPSARALASELNNLLQYIGSASGLDSVPAEEIADDARAYTIMSRLCRFAAVAAFAGLTVAGVFVALATASPSSVPAFVPARLSDAAAEVGRVSSSTLVRLHDRAGERVSSGTEALSDIFSEPADAAGKTNPASGSSEVTAPVRRGASTTEHRPSTAGPPETTGGGSTQVFAKPGSPASEAGDRRDPSPRQTFDAGPSKQSQ